MTMPDAFGCVVWKGKRDGDGYGVDGKQRAHVVAYERARGGITPGMFVDHLCRNRACVAPHHLELVSKDTNEQRKALAHRLRRRLCPAFHDMTYNRVMTPNGGVVCRECNRRARAS